MREPKVINKYNLKPADIEKAIILKPERLKEAPFWRNNIVNAWCLSDNTAKTSADLNFGTYNEYWIGFFDDGKIKLSRSSFGGMCTYNFDEFFNAEDIENEIDLEIQEKLLFIVNWLLDENIITILAIHSDIKENPIKVIYTENPCPKNPLINCSHSVIEYDNTDMIIYCDLLYCKYEEDLI